MRVEFVNRRWADLAKMAQQGQLQVWMLGNTAYTGDAMMFALYGPNANNLARFRNAEFDALYLASKRERDDTARQKDYEHMQRIIGAWNPWGLRVWAIRTSFVRRGSAATGATHISCSSGASSTLTSADRSPSPTDDGALAPDCPGRASASRHVGR